MFSKQLQNSMWLIEHDAKNEGVFERWVVEALHEGHAEGILRSKDPTLDWGSGRFVARITWLGLA